MLKLDTSVPPPMLEALFELEQPILDALPLAFYACDGEGQIIRFNQRAAELWGRAPRLLDPTQRFCGSFRVESLDGDFIPPEETPMARAVLAGERFEGAEAVVQNPDGRRWIARVNVAPLVGSDGAPIGAVNCFQDVTRECEARLVLERSQRNFDLAMIASKMGTWRYTLADNICTYDNAQELYGLLEARFLHDEAGVKDKFHADDLPLMWERVAKALAPDGDGRYDVEYRVKQHDGSWRWLSAWGLVEFEGKDADRKAVAISGASRDLTDLKRAEDLQRLLLNELNHRVKNAFAIVQSMVVQTLRGAKDVGVAREALQSRILALATAHDQLIHTSWSAADLAQAITRALRPFALERFTIEGASIDLAAQEILAVSLALHELATNAAKYGALSKAEGRVTVRWDTEHEILRLTWRESGGPPVVPPLRRGFGSRLLETGLFQDGQTRLEFLPEGVHCAITLLCGAIASAQVGLDSLEVRSGAEAFQ